MLLKVTWYSVLSPTLFVCFLLQYSSPWQTSAFYWVHLIVIEDIYTNVLHAIITLAKKIP